MLCIVAVPDATAHCHRQCQNSHCSSSATKIIRIFRCKHTHTHTHTHRYHSSIVPLPGSRSSGVCALLLCILSVTWPMMMQTRTSIIHLLFYTIQFIFSPLMHLSTATLRRALSLLSLSAAFSRSQSRAPAANQLGLRPQAPPRFRDA